MDDSKADAGLAEHILRQCKILNPVSFFGSGKALIKQIDAMSERSLNGELEPSLIFLDLTMPEMTGLDVLTSLGSHPYAKHCISIMLSGLKDIKAINKGYQLGAKTFLLKPLTKCDIVELLNSLNDHITIEDLPAG